MMCGKDITSGKLKVYFSALVPLVAGFLRVNLKLMLKLCISADILYL